MPVTVQTHTLILKQRPVLAALQITLMMQRQSNALKGNSTLCSLQRQKELYLKPMIILFPNTKMTRQRSKAKPEVFNVQVIDPIRLRVDVSDVTRQAHTLTSDYKAVRLVHQEKFTSKQAINAFCLLT